MIDQEHKVVIVGAGLGGLSTAVFLALSGVKAVLIERNASTSILPKARGQNPVTMEMLRVAGITDAIHAARPEGAPAITSLESESLTGKVIYDHIANRPDFSRFSPERPGLASQARAEEALLKRALELGVEIRFNTECESVTEEDERVVVKARDLQTDEAVTMVAQYLVAADGIRGAIRESLGVGHHGVGHLKAVTAVRFNADLLPWAGNNCMVIHYVQNNELPDASGVLVSTDYKNQWVANFSADPDRSDEETRRLIYILLGLTENDVQIEVTGHTIYNYSHRIADRLSTKRVFFVGDTAHVMPPTGGQGGNAAMQDGFYLGWMLGYVLQGIASPTLLEAYDAERRPYAEIVCTWQAANLAQRRDMAHLAEVVGQPIDHATMMFAYVRTEGAFVKLGGAQRPTADHPFEDPANPSGLPGARVPYVKLTSSGKEIITRNCLQPRFQIYTANAGLAATIAELADDLNVPHEVITVDSMKPLQRTDEDILLVRPDGIIGWYGNQVAELHEALQLILGV